MDGLIKRSCEVPFLAKKKAVTNCTTFQDDGMSPLEKKFKARRIENKGRYLIRETFIYSNPCFWEKKISEIRFMVCTETYM